MGRNYEIHVHFLPSMGPNVPPCGIGTGKLTMFDYDVTSIPSKVTCGNCLKKMEGRHAHASTARI